MGYSGKITKLRSVLRQNSSVTLNLAFCRTPLFSGEMKCFTGEAGRCSDVFGVSCCLSVAANDPTPACIS